MTQEAALHQFWNQFGVDAFPNTAVSIGDQSEEYKPLSKYITYQVVSGYFSGTANPSVQVRYYTDNLSALNALVDKIAKAIGGGVIIPCDSGGIKITMGEPWSTPTVVNTDNPMWKLRQLNVRMEFIVYI